MDRYHCQMLARAQKNLKIALEQADYWRLQAEDCRHELEIWQKILKEDDDNG